MRAAVICAYQPDGNQTTSVPLTGSVRLPGTQLPAISEDLAFLPRRAPGQRQLCTLIGSTRPPVSYLVGLGYRNATMWISTTVDPNWCVDTTNGSFTSSTYIGDQVDAAFQAGAWVAPAARPLPDKNAPAACSPPRTGRLGQDSELVPGTPIAVDICNDSTKLATVKDGVRTLAAAFNKLPTTASKNSCSAPRGVVSPTYRVVFRYEQGPPVLVRVDAWCDPPIDNGSLQSRTATPVIPLLNQHAPRRSSDTPPSR
jgi:hypothetical protein